MPIITPFLVFIVLAAGTVAGGLGATLGIGGGIFLVPFLTIGMGMPIGVAAAISLTTVIGTSSTVSAGRTGSHLINYRLGMVLEVATAAGSLLGGITAQYMNQHTLEQVFAGVTAIVGVTTLSRLNKRNIVVGDGLDTGTLGGRYVELHDARELARKIGHQAVGPVGAMGGGGASRAMPAGGGGNNAAPSGTAGAPPDPACWLSPAL